MTTTFVQAQALARRSRTLLATFPPLFAESAALIKRSRELCLAHRRIAGGSDVDTPYIVEIIARAPMCLGCLAKKSGIPSARAVEAVERIRGFMQVTEYDGRCGGCLAVTRIFGLDGAATVQPTPRPAQTEVVWQYLESHRGRMFCTQCIASALSATRRIDRAILAAEGRGARRQHGVCTTCGRERLLCGLLR